MSAGGVTDGFSLSSTVTVCDAEAVRPPASVAIQLIVVTPFGYASESASPSLLVPVTVTPAASSVAVATPGFATAAHVPMAEPTEASLLAPASADGAVVTSRLGGGVMTGGVFARGSEKRIASFVRAKYERTLPGTKAASVPVAFSMPCVTT